MKNDTNKWCFPQKELQALQAQWLTDARARLLRLAEIGRRQRILDLGCGSGEILPELQQRSQGFVVALDLYLDPLRQLQNVSAVNADAVHLPFGDRSFDLIFSQNVLLWIPELGFMIEQAYRVLNSNGVFVMIEADYGGLLEYPESIDSKPLWIEGLLRAGADPFVGRKLMTLFPSTKWKLRVEILPRVVTPSQERFLFLEDLPLTLDEQQTLKRIRAESVKIPSEFQVAHLTYFLVLAEKL